MITLKLPGIQKFVFKVKEKYELGTIVYEPGNVLFFGLQVIQESEMSITTYCDEKLNPVVYLPISRNQRKIVDEILNELN